MLKQLALILAIAIVALLAIVAALTVVNRGSGTDDGETANTPVVVIAPQTTIMVSVGVDGSQVEVGCRGPVDGQSPFLVSFENQTGVTDDFQARVLVRYDDGSALSVVAEASALRPGERRNVLPETWLEPSGITACEVEAVQTSDRVILVESG